MEGGDFVGREELLEMLVGAGVKMGRTTLRRYQALGIVPRPSAYGRPGKAKGVSWGWTRKEAAEVVRRVRIVKAHKRRGMQLVQVIASRPELSEVLAVLLDEEREEGRKEGREEGYAEGYQDGLEQVSQHPVMEVEPE